MHNVVDGINLAGQLRRVEIKRRASWQLHTVQHAHNVAALIANQLPSALIHQQRSCAAPSVPRTGCIIDFPASEHHCLCQPMAGQIHSE